jgi:hypothetical protein
VIAVLPNFVTRAEGLTGRMAYFLGGTSVLIVVGVAMDLVDKLNAQLVMRNYEGFMKQSGRHVGRGGTGELVMQVLDPPRASGAGKGTQAVRLGEAAGPHVSTGRPLPRERPRARRSDSARRVTWTRASSVPDDVVLDMLFERVAQPDCASGYVLDGFPRTLAQAEALDERRLGRRRVRAVDLACPTRPRRAR